MAVAAIRPEPSLDPACVARVIPGQRVAKPRLRKGPQAVLADGKPRPATEEDSRAFPVRAFAEFLLPTPFSGSDRHRLCPALIADYACVLASWLGLAFLRSIGTAGVSVFQSTEEVVPNTGWLGTAMLFALVMTLLGYSEGLYRQLRGSLTSTVILAKAVAWTTVLVGACVRLVGASEPPIGWITGSALLSFSALVFWRVWYSHAKGGGREGPTRNVLVVGTTAAARKVVTHIRQHPELRKAVRGSLVEDSVLTLGLPYLGTKLATMARTEFVDEVILAAPLRREVAQTVIREARRNHLDVKAVPDLYGCDVRQPGIEDLGFGPLLTLHEETLPRAGLFLKRLLDVVLSGCALLVTGPLMAAVACLVKIDTPGPALYSALRVGRKGKRFRCHKFRTMVVNAGDFKENLRKQNGREGPTFKIVGDPRITRVGGWLRRYSLDELPQLWNVLTGDMSLVGPRPHPLDDFERYELEHLRRLDVTPGITGLWQVTARHSASFHINMALDLEYIERWSLWMDLKILLRTVAVVLQGTGA